MTTPVTVTVIASDKKPGQLIAFYGKQLCLFENDSRQLRVGEEVQVMFTRAFYKRTPDGYYDYDNLSFLFIRPVTDDYIVVEHNGFECAGSMCRTTASGFRPGADKKNWRESISLTPGRTGVYVAENVNTRYGEPGMPRKPGHVFVKKDDWKNGVVRAEGLLRIEDAVWGRVVRK